jgi:hypothetical protein
LIGGKEPSSIEQTLNIKVQLLKIKPVKNKKEFENDSVNDLATTANDFEKKKKTLTDLEYLSHFEDVETFTVKTISRKMLTQYRVTAL